MQNPRLPPSERLPRTISQRYIITDTEAPLCYNRDDKIRATFRQSPPPPPQPIERSRLLQAPPIVAWEQGNPAHQALKALPACSGLDHLFSVERSCSAKFTCLKSILPRPPQQSCPSAKLLISAAAGLVISFHPVSPPQRVTRGDFAPPLGWGAGPLAFKETRPAGRLSWCPQRLLAFWEM